MLLRKPSRMTGALWMTLVLALCTARLGSAQLADSAWPMRGYDPQHTGRSPYTGVQWAHLKWTLSTGGVLDSSPTIGPDGTIYAGSADQHFYALSPDGTVKWSYRTGGEVASSACIGCDGTIYVGSEDGTLYAFNPDGSVKWRYGTGYD